MDNNNMASDSGKNAAGVLLLLLNVWFVAWFLVM